MKATPVGSLHCLYTFQKAISSPLRETPHPKRITKKHKQRNNNKNNCPSDRGTRNLQVNFGGSIKSD